jgi:CelD/BcsL family acetyltransferase involved in cellulose biosynthesis
VQVDFWPLPNVPSRVVDAWRDLAGRALEPNPYAEPELVLSAARWLPHQPAAELLTVTDRNEMVACLPVTRRRKWRRIPWPTIAVWRHDYAFLGTPMIDADQAGAACGALLRAGTARRSMLALEWMPSDGPVCAAVAQAAADHAVRPVVYEQFARAAVAPTEAAPRLTLSSDRRRKLRRMSRRLGTMLAADVQVADRAGDSAAVERFLALEAAGWKGRAGTAMASRPGHGDFLREVCRSYADVGRLRLHVLEAGDRMAAAMCTLRAGDGLFLFKIAHEPELAAFSPGIQLVVAGCEGSDARWIDSCASPEEVWLNQLFPSTRKISTLLIPPRGEIGKALTSGVGAFVRARDTRGGRSLR